MNIRMENGLPIVSLEIEHLGKVDVLRKVLLDTGCATTIFDTDLLAQIGIELDIFMVKRSECTG
jgi:hypothetical protein